MALPAGEYNIPYPLPTSHACHSPGVAVKLYCRGNFFWHQQWNSGLVDFAQRRTLAVITVSVMAFFLCLALCSMGAACFMLVLHACIPAHAVDETTN